MKVWLCSLASMAPHTSTLTSRCSWRLVPALLPVEGEVDSIVAVHFLLVHLADAPQTLVQFLLANTRFYISGVQ